MAQTKIKGKQVEQFSVSSDGVVPAPSVSTGKYLKDDGTWDTPAGGGGVTITSGTTFPSGGNDGDIYLQYI